MYTGPAEGVRREIRCLDSRSLQGAGADWLERRTRMGVDRTDGWEAQTFDDRLQCVGHVG